MRISEKEQYVLGKLNIAGIDTFKVGMHFLMKKLKNAQLLIVAVVDNNGILNIVEADKYDVAVAPEYTPLEIKFPGPTYVVKMPRYDLYISTKKR